jgi:hypothetical protein
MYSPYSCRNSQCAHRKCTGIITSFALLWLCCNQLTCKNAKRGTACTDPMAADSTGETAPVSGSSVVLAVFSPCLRRTLLPPWAQFLRHARRHPQSAPRLGPQSAHLRTTISKSRNGARRGNSTSRRRPTGTWGRSWAFSTWSAPRRSPAPALPSTGEWARSSSGRSPTSCSTTHARARVHRGAAALPGELASLFGTGQLPKFKEDLFKCEGTTCG